MSKGPRNKQQGGQAPDFLLKSPNRSARLHVFSAIWVPSLPWGRGVTTPASSLCPRKRLRELLSGSYPRPRPAQRTLAQCLCFTEDTEAEEGMSQRTHCRETWEWNRSSKQVMLDPVL